jgi:serine/threonine-protein kinase
VSALGQIRAALSARYVVERELGRGGMATVYLARDTKHNRSVAIKVLRPELADLLGRERFLREIEIAARLQHPNIVPLYDSGADGGLLYYVMRFVEGESLRDRLDREKQLSVDDALQIAREVADALAFAHSLGFVHRDIKPGNILLSDGHALVADFGIARAIAAAGGSDLTERGIAVGTPAYMSPEQGSGQDSVDSRSDVYSLACVLFEMLAGDPPFSGRTAQALIARHQQEPPPPLSVVRPTVPPAIQAAIETALAKVPADRFATAMRFSDALMTTRERRAQPIRSRLRVGLTVAALMTLGAGGWWLWQRSNHRFAGVGPPPLDPTHIAVLYFEDLSEGGRLSHVAAGLTEDLIDELGQVPILHVISPDGVRPYRGRAVGLDSIARRLGIGTLVTGSMVESGGRLRVTVRLTDPVTGVQLLSQNIEHLRGDLLQLQDEIAHDVSQGLRQRLGRVIELRERRAGTTSSAAWELVQRAEALRADASESGDRWIAGRALVTADSLLAEAERHDPKWAEPIVMRGWLAYDQTTIPMAGNPTLGVSAGRTTSEWIRLGLGHAARALRLHPGDPAALELQGTIYYRMSGLPLVAVRDTPPPLLESAQRDLQAAAAVPSRTQARTWSTLSVVLEAAGKYAEANRAAQQAFEADAFLRDADEIVFRLFKTAFELERLPDAIRWCEQGQRSFPNDWYFPYCHLQLLGWPLTAAPNARSVWRVVEDVRRVSAPEDWVWLGPRVHMMAAAALARVGLPDSADRVIRRARTEAPDDPQLLYYEAVARLRLAQPDSALHLLAALVGQSPEDKPYLRVHSLFRPLWGDPRFQAMMRD